jgi:amidase
MTQQAREPFRPEEATIDELQQAIRDGRTTCVAVVKQYIDRVRAYNGVSSMLVTEDGEPIPEAPGVIRGKAAIRFPTATTKASAILPDLDKYTGPPLEFGQPPLIERTDWRKSTRHSQWPDPSGPKQIVGAAPTRI